MIWLMQSEELRLKFVRHGSSLHMGGATIGGGGTCPPPNKCGGTGGYKKWRVQGYKDNYWILTLTPTLMKWTLSHIQIPRPWLRKLSSHLRLSNSQSCTSISNCDSRWIQESAKTVTSYIQTMLEDAEFDNILAGVDSQIELLNLEHLSTPRARN